MKIDNDKQKHRFIEIESMDLGDFTDIALLVDNEYFLEEVKEMRRKYKLTYDFPFQDNKPVDDFILKRHHDSKIKSAFESDIERIRKLFHRPQHFIPVIESSIIYGFVGKHNYSKAYLEEQEAIPDDNPEAIPDKKYCIVIHAGTREPDVTKVFREFKEKVKINARGSEEERKNYHYGYWADLSLQKMKDTMGAIEAIRGWFVSGKKPLEIALVEYGYTYKEYKELKKKIKNPISHFNKLEVKNHKQIENRLNGILDRRNSIKEQLRQYRRLLETSTL